MHALFAVAEDSLRMALQRNRIRVREEIAARVSRLERLISANSKVRQGRERRRTTRESANRFVLHEQCPNGCAFGLPNCLITGDTANRKKG